MSKRSVGLFFGSFNPVHIGHMILANYMATQTPLDEVWLVVSPHNPHKKRGSLANDHARLHLVELAIDDTPKLRASRIEFDLPKPSYTVDTLAVLRDRYPQLEFSLIMGSDNIATFHKWKNFELILRDFQIQVYLRPGYPPGDLAEHPNVHIHEAPLMHLSASYIRSCVAKGYSVKYLVPEAVVEELERTGMYK